MPWLSGVTSTAVVAAPSQLPIDCKYWISQACCLSKRFVCLWIYVQLTCNAAGESCVRNFNLHFGLLPPTQSVFILLNLSIYENTKCLHDMAKITNHIYHIYVAAQSIDFILLHVRVQINSDGHIFALTETFSNRKSIEFKWKSTNMRSVYGVELFPI